MNRLERLYAINESIRRNAPQAVSAARLAEEFEVSRRTIERDLASLRAAGVPLYADHGRYGGQRTAARPEKVVLTLSVAEVSALLIALSSAGDTPFGDAGRTATKRLLDVLPTVTRVGVDELRSRIRTGAGDHPIVKPRVRRTLETAVQKSLVVNLDYQDAQDERTSRSVEAIGFYNGTDGWYLIGWCQLRDGGRLFRLDRILSARLTKRPIGDRDLDSTLGWIPHETLIP